MSLGSVSGKFHLNGFPIHYEIFGTGGEIVLLIAGGIGTARSDFPQLLEGPDAFDFKRYTFVAVELPGWGRSRPPQRPYGLKVFKNDSDCCFQLMTNLGFKIFSIIGWSDGGKVGLTMSHMNPNRVKSVVVISIAIQINEKLFDAFKKTRDVNNWPKEQLDRYISVYGDQQTVEELWVQIIDFLRDLKNGKYDTEGNPQHCVLSIEELKTIRIPVLIVYGDRDPLLDMDQIQICQNCIPEITSYKFAQGSHNCHQEFSAQFKKIVESFFQDCDNSF